MDLSEEIVKKNTPEESADNNKTEGEITDDAAGDVVGGMWGFPPKELPHRYQESDISPSLKW